MPCVSLQCGRQGTLPCLPVQW